MTTPLAERECLCFLCQGSGTMQEWPELERRNAAQVGKHGYCVTGVVGTASPDWAYSIGLWHSYGSPDLCILGVPQQRAMRIVDTLGRQIRKGRSLQPGELRKGVVKGYDLAVAPVHESWYERLLGPLIAYYQQPPAPVVQLIWPDRNGRYLDSHEATADYRLSQPSLWLPREENPKGPWTQPDHTWFWPWPTVDRHQISFTLNRLVSGEEPVLGVVHSDDGSWQFLDGKPFTKDDITPIHLVDFVANSPAAMELLDLPVGWCAWRDVDGPWERSKSGPERE